MSQLEYEALVAVRLRTMRIIVLALVAGSTTLAAVAGVIRAQGNAPAPPNPDLPLLLFVGLVLAGMELAVLSFLPRQIVTTGRRQIAQGTWPAGAVPPGDTTADFLAGLCAVYQTQLIIRSALLEGLAFYFGIAYLIEGHPASLVAAAVFILLLAWQLPTRDRLERWLGEQQELLRQERDAA